MTTTTNNKRKAAIAAIALLAALAGGAWYVYGRDSGAPGDGHGHAHEEAGGHADGEHHGESAKDGHKDAEGHGDKEHGHAEAPKGPNGGSLTTQDGVTVEVALAEEGGEPRLRLWVTQDGKPVAPGGLSASADLQRATGESERFDFKPARDFLQSAVSIDEPHAFDASIAVTLPGMAQPVTARFSKEEGKVELSADQIQAADIQVQPAGAARVQASLQLPGEIKFNEDRTAHVVPRLAGVVENVPANLGQQVRQGQLLAVIASTALSEQRSELLTAQRRLDLARSTFEREEKLWKDRISAEQDYQQARAALQEAQIAQHNAQQKLVAIGAAGNAKSLSQFELRAPFDGTIVEKHISLGEAVAADANVFTLSDLRTVWAEITVPAQDIGKVRVGEKVVVASTASNEKAEGTVSYVGSLIGAQTRTATARVTLANPQGAWRPGLFVTVTVIAQEVDAPVAVRAEAVQTLGDRSVVFLAVPGGFVAQPVKVGRSGGPFVEIQEGLKPGMRYAASNSYVLKSELGKASAEHTH